MTNADHAPILELARRAKSLFDIQLTESQLTQFQALTALLLDWNARMNLTRIANPAEIALLHYLDSLALLPHLADLRRPRLLDVGSGAGFPGMPLAIARPQTRVTLLDSTAKKLRFIEAAGAALGLENIRVLHARAEDAGRDDAPTAAAMTSLWRAP